MLLDLVYKKYWAERNMSVSNQRMTECKEFCIPSDLVPSTNKRQEKLLFQSQGHPCIKTDLRQMSIKPVGGAHVNLDKQNPIYETTEAI